VKLGISIIPQTWLPSSWSCPRQPRRTDFMSKQGLGFRKHLQQMGHLMSAEAQMVALAASLPPVKERELWEKFDWKCHYTIRVERLVSLFPLLSRVGLTPLHAKMNVPSHQHTELEVSSTRSSSACTPMFVDTAFNSLTVAAANLFAGFREAALRMLSYFAVSAGD